MLKAVLFDMDGVLVDTERVYDVLHKEIGKEMGIPFADFEFKKYMGVASLEMWRDLKAKYRFSKEEQELADMTAVYMDKYYMNGDLYTITPSVELLKRCADAGLKVAIATSSKIENARHVVERLGIERYVNAISTSCIAGASKPAPDIFLLAAKMLGAMPEECVVIEDSESGLKAAKNAGMKAVALKYEDYGLDYSAADMIMSSCDELTVDILRNLLEPEGMD